MDLNQMDNLDNGDESSPGNEMNSKLNHDCLAKILMYVPVLERLEMENVCQKWKEASELSWYCVKKLNFDDLMITLDKREEILKMIMMRCRQYLTHLTIIVGQYPWMSHVLKYDCQNIIHFSIDINITHGYKISNENLVEIIMSMTQLKYLRVLMDLRGSSILCYRILNILPKNMKEIHLIVPDSILDPSREVVQVPTRFNGLHCLSLQGFYLTNATLKSILQNKNTLTKLDLSNCGFPINALPILSYLKNLEHLILWLITNFDKNEIFSIAHNCSKLKQFAFADVSPDTVPYHIFRELKYLKLKHLSIFDMNTPSGAKNQISDIANNWKQLKYLNVGRGYDFSLLDFHEITKFKNLEFLNLAHAEIDSQSFINIASNCLELKELIMCFRFLPETALEKLKNLNKLEFLNFENCSNVTGNLLFKIANNCKNLVDLNLHRCHNVTEASLIQVGKLQHLKKLNIDYIDNVPNEMFDNLYKLEYLSCRNCQSVNDETIIKVVDNCQKLSYLRVRETGITVRTLDHASKRQFVFKKLIIHADKSVKQNYRRNTFRSPYLEIR